MFFSTFTDQNISCQRLIIGGYYLRENAAQWLYVTINRQSHVFYGFDEVFLGTLIKFFFARIFSLRSTISENH